MYDVPIFTLVSSGLENFLYVALGSLLTAIGYLVKRRLEKKPTLEDLEVSERAMRLLKELSTQNLSIEEFHTRREQILTPRKSLVRQERGALVELTQVVREVSSAGDVLENLNWRFRVEDRLYRRINQEESAMFAALETLLDALSARKAFSEAMDIIESQNEWRKTWPDLKVMRVRYEAPGVGIMLHHAELAVVMWERAVVLRKKLREIEGRKESEQTPDVLIDDRAQSPEIFRVG